MNPPWLVASLNVEGFRAEPGGIRFGCHLGIRSEADHESTTSPAGDPRDILAFAPRQRDRRMGLGDVLMALTRALKRAYGPFFDARRIRRDAAPSRARPCRATPRRARDRRWTRGGAGATGRGSAGETLGDRGNPPAESITLEVRVCVERLRDLEASFDPGARLGDWDSRCLARLPSRRACARDRARPSGAPAFGSRRSWRAWRHTTAVAWAELSG